MQTPEFLLWALGYSCPLRAEQDGSDPERTERQLRAARAASDAGREGRIFEGLAVDPPTAFRLSETLSLYGGESGLRACEVCPANLDDGGQWAGCYGRIVIHHDSNFHAAMDAAFDRQTASGAQGLPRTTPRWYGLWMNGPLTSTRAAAVVGVLRCVDRWDAQTQPEADRLIAALETVIRRSLVLHAAMYPHGHVSSWRWQVASHCPRCKVTWWPQAKQHPRCLVCGFEGQPVPKRNRHARGCRPYRALDRLLGPSEAAAFQARYAEFRARQESPDRTENPPRPAPRDNLQAD